MADNSTNPYPSNDLDEPVNGTVVDDESEPGRELDKFDRFLIDRNQESADPEIDAYQAIIEQILTAESPDDVLTPIEAKKASDMVDVPLILHGFEMNESEYDAGSPFYASMKVVNALTGEPCVVNCGHKRVLAQLVKLDQFQQYPYQVMFKEQGKSKKSGSPMLVMVKWTNE